MDAGIQCDFPVNNAEKKISGGGDTTVSFLQKVHIVYYILLQYPYELSFSIQTVSRKEGAGEITESSTQHRTESDDEEGSSAVTESPAELQQSSTMMHPSNIVHKSLYKFIQTAV